MEPACPKSANGWPRSPWLRARQLRRATISHALARAPRSREHQALGPLFASPIGAPTPGASPFVAKLGHSPSHRARRRHRCSWQFRHVVTPLERRDARSRHAKSPTIRNYGYGGRKDIFERESSSAQASWGFFRPWASESRDSDDRDGESGRFAGLLGRFRAGEKPSAREFRGNPRFSQDSVPWSGHSPACPGRRA